MTSEAQVPFLAEAELERVRSLTWWGQVWRRFRQTPSAQIAAVGLIVIVVIVILAPLISPFDPRQHDVPLRLRPPIWEANGVEGHILGTDAFGRDLLTRLIFGGRVSLLVGLLCSSIGVAVGISLGLIAGMSGGSLLDRFIVRFADIWIAFPFLVLAIAVMAVLGSDLIVLVALLSVFGWVFPCRVTRASTLHLRNIEYVQAATAMGASRARIIFRHILPNVMVPNLVLWTILIGSLILVESSLSFLGFGVQPPEATWGNLLADGRNFLERAPWISVFPGLAIALTVLLVNTLGDSMRDILDPRLR